MRSQRPSTRFAFVESSSCFGISQSHKESQRILSVWTPSNVLRILVLCFAVPLRALPPPVPGGGVIERQIEKEYEATPLELEKPLPPVQIDIPEEKLEMPEGVSVQVQCITIRGNRVVPSQEINQWIAPFLGRKLTLQEIYEVCRQIEAGYAVRGYVLARVYPPPQTIKNECLVLCVVEGCLGTVSVTGNRFYSTKFIESYFQKLVGNAFNYDTFMRALLLLNDNSDLRAGSVLTKGRDMGTADVELVVQDSWPAHLYLNANNYGRNLTTNWRTGARFDVGSLGWYGDKLSIAEVVGFPLNALYFTDVVYSVPLTRNGLSMELSYLFSKFKVEEMLALRLSGESNIGTLRVSQAVRRTTKMSIDASSWFDVMQIENIEQGAIISFDKLRVLRGACRFDWFGSPKMRECLNLQASVGIPSVFGGLPPVSAACSRAGAGGLFVKLNADLDYLQKVYHDASLLLHVSGQWSFFRLPIPEQVYLGGADTVRGYPLAAALGDSGYYANFELHVPPPLLANLRFFRAKAKWKEVCQLVAFLDQGGVFLRGGQNTFETGAGLGVRLQNIWKLSLSLDVGFPLVHNDLSSGAFTYIKVTGCPF